MVSDFETLDKCRGKQHEMDTFRFLEFFMKAEQKEEKSHWNASGKEFTLLWLRDYKTYWWESVLYDFDYFSDDLEAPTTSTLPVPKQEAKLGEEVIDYSKLNDFLFSPLHKHWKIFLKLR